MRVKSGPSTAQRLAQFREQLQQHYRSLRSDKCKKVVKPSAEMFPGVARMLAIQIGEEELQRHEKAVAEIERLKQFGHL